MFCNGMIIAVCSQSLYTFNGKFSDINSFLETTLAEKIFVLQSAKVCRTVKICRAKVCRTVKICRAKVCQTMQNCQTVHNSVDFRHFAQVQHRLADFCTFYKFILIIQHSCAQFNTLWYTLTQLGTVNHSLAQRWHTLTQIIVNFFK